MSNRPDNGSASPHGMPVRRIKSYTGQTGYVYQYYFVGHRPALPDAPERPATEYVFDVTADREQFFAVSVFLREEALRFWVAAHGRELTEAERYAAAKMRLFGAFDEVSDLVNSSRRFDVDVQSLQFLLESLGVE